MDNSPSVISITDDLKMIKFLCPYWPESANVYVFKDEDGISLFDVAGWKRDILVKTRGGQGG